MNLLKNWEDNLLSLSLTTVKFNNSILLKLIISAPCFGIKETIKGASFKYCVNKKINLIFHQERNSWVQQLGCTEWCRKCIKRWVCWSVGGEKKDSSNSIRTKTQIDNYSSLCLQKKIFSLIFGLFCFLFGKKSNNCFARSFTFCALFFSWLLPFGKRRNHLYLLFWR